MDPQSMTDRQLPAGLHPDTLAVRTGHARSQYGENSEALYLTSGFVQPDAEASRAALPVKKTATPTAAPATPPSPASSSAWPRWKAPRPPSATASGMAAILLMCMGLLKAGDHVVCSQSMFGSTIKLIGKEFAKFGVETTFVSQTDVAAWRAAVRPNTKLLFAETPTNPLTEVCDIAALADIAHNAGALLAVDNCFATPALQRPVALGADIVMHSGTKYLDGQGRVMAGALCASQKLIVRDKFAPCSAAPA
jgi:O-succinylhomoserine sulfhydrylase